MFCVRLLIDFISFEFIAFYIVFCLHSCGSKVQDSL